MDARRLRYLKLLDIDCYEPRPRRGTEPSPALSPLPPSASPPAPRPSPPATPRSLQPASHLDELASQVAGCTACPLHQGRNCSVVGSGPAEARWMFIGEAPGAEEDRQGLPFVGRAGLLLTSMLEAIGEAREGVYIANTVKCRPPQNRDPTAEEAAACRHFLDRQVALVAPQLIVALGRIAAQNLLATAAPLGQLRGRVHLYPGTQIPLVVTYHPAYLLRSPKEKRKAWEDLLYAQRQLASVAPEGHTSD